MKSNSPGERRRRSCSVLSREVNSGNGGLSLTLYSLFLAPK